MSGVRSHANTNGKYSGWYYDGKGEQRHFVGTDSKTGTRDIARKLEDKHRPTRLGLEPEIADQLNTPIADAINQYMTWGKISGGRRGRPWSATHQRMRKTHLDYWVEAIALEHVGDLVGCQADVESAISKLTEKGLGGKALVGKTIANYVEAIASFCDFLLKRKMLFVDPLKHLSRIDSTPVTRRRAMTPEEIRALLATCANHRRLCYEVAFSSGLRANELRSLKVRDLDVAGGGLRLHQSWTKNRKEGFQPLNAALLERLAVDCAGKDRNAPLLYVASHTARDLDKDLDRAGIDPEDNGDGKIDFHACRVAYTTMVLESGANLKEAQDLARHADPNLTMNVYGRSRSDRRQELAESVGTMLSGHATSMSTSKPSQWRRRESNPNPSLVHTRALLLHIEPTSRQTHGKPEQIQVLVRNSHPISSSSGPSTSEHNPPVLLHPDHAVGMLKKSPAGRDAEAAGDGPLAGASPRQIRQLKLRAKRAEDLLAGLGATRSRSRLAAALRDLLGVIQEVMP